MRESRRHAAIVTCIAALALALPGAAQTATRAPENESSAKPTAGASSAASLTSGAIAAPLPGPSAGATASPTPEPFVEPAPPLGARAKAHRTITTTSVEAQAAYDHGLLYLYAFNIGAAREAFAHAEALDPNAAMAPYGQALAEITDINVDPDAAAIARGNAAIQRALKAREASPDERDLIAAAAIRFGRAKSQEDAKKAYEAAMTTYAEAHPKDDDGALEAAFAIWDAEPNATTPAAGRVGEFLDRILVHDPAQFGARHLRIHYEEEAGRPEMAIADADFLAHAVYEPGESHLPHMAGHIYSRVGDYDKMTKCNQDALANDAEYFMHDSGPGVDYMKTYHNHDLSFVLYGLTTLGKNDEARATATKENARTSVQVALRLHDWNYVLASGTTNKFFTALANARAGRTALAQTQITADKEVPAALKALVLGAIATEKGDAAGAVTQDKIAYDARPGDLGDPKEYWATPIGEIYATSLLRAKRWADAERIFTAELKRYPNDPRLLYGRSLALEALGENAEADRTASASLWEGTKPLTLDDLG